VPTFPKGTVVRVLQEDWAVFQNMRRTVQHFSSQTGVEVEVTLSTIPEFWTLMEQSFMADEPRFDLIGADEIMLLQYARDGRRAGRCKSQGTSVWIALCCSGRRADLSP